MADNKAFLQMNHEGTQHRLEVELALDLGRNVDTVGDSPRQGEDGPGLEEVVQETHIQSLSLSPKTEFAPCHHDMIR